MVVIRGSKRSVSVLFPENLYVRIKEQARQDGHTLSAEIRQVLRGYLEYIDRGGVSWCKFGANRGIERYEEQ